jgi:membrane protein required for colicin V production
MFQGYDLFMLIVLAAAIAWGAWKGFAWQMASLASVVLSYFVALNFRQPVAAILSRSVEVKPPLDVFLAMLILFLGTSLVVWIVFNLVFEIIYKFKLKEFDHQVGAIFGLAKGVLLCVLITLFAVTLLSEPQRQAICNSKSGYYIAILLDKADAVIPSEVHGVLDPYIDRLDREITHPHTEGGFQLPELPALPKNLLGGQGTDSPLDGSGLSGFPAPREIIRAKPATGSFGSETDPPDAASRPAAAPRRW